jgi:hypothetical protein
MKMVHRIFLIAALAVCALSTSHATTYFVNASTGNDGNNGTSSGTAFKTIMHALSVAANTDVINVAAGTYNTGLGEIFPLNMVSGVTLTGTAGALSTIIDAAGAGTRVINCTGGSNTTVIQGFTITGGYNAGNSSTNFTAHGGGISFTGGDQTTLQKNVITGNTAIGYGGTMPTYISGGDATGGGIYVSSASPTIVNNVISSNSAQGGKGYNTGFANSDQAYNGGRGTGGGIDASSANTITIINNTFYGNTATGGNGGFTLGDFARPNGGDGLAGGVYAGFSTTVTVENNIFANNSAVGGNAGSGTSGGSDGNASSGALESSAAGNAGNLSFNLYFNNSATTDPDGSTLGSNNITASNPLFVSASDYHFSSTSSPAYHAGTATGAPAADFDGTARGGTPSIGAYESTTPLPVEMASFSATANSRSAELRWTTATEVNNYGFEIERRGVNSQFTKVGFVAGAGSTTSPRKYSFEDKNIPSGQYAYRIKQINQDGTFKYTSEVRVLIDDIPKAFSLGQNFPNPFNPSTMIAYDVPSAGLVHLAVYDQLGRKVAELVNEQKSPGHFQVEWNAANVSSGNYYVRMESRGFSATRKMALLK